MIRDGCQASLLRERITAWPFHRNRNFLCILGRAEGATIVVEMQHMLEPTGKYGISRLTLLSEKNGCV